jgi:hypothetical protein
MSVSEIFGVIKDAKWVSLSTELRPSTVKSENGTLKPLYCSREFEFPADDLFTLKFKNYADPFGKVPLVEMAMTGHMIFGPEHPVAKGAYEIDYVADVSFIVTVLSELLAAPLNKYPSPDLGEWTLNVPKEVLGKSVPAFGLQAGEPFKEYDLIFIDQGMLFNGSRNVDGRPFDKPENRPTNLQIPLKKISKN